MVRAWFRLENGGFQAVRVSGHADFAPQGEDIVCASVTSAVQLVANAVTEILKLPAKVAVEENQIEITLPPGSPPNAGAFLQALHLHLSLLREEYPQHITVTVTEV